MCINFFILKSFTIYFKIHRWRQCHWRRFVLYLSSPVNIMYTLVGGCHSISWGSNYWTRVGIGPSSITEPECVLALPQLLNQSEYWPVLNYWTRVSIDPITEPECVLTQLLNQSLYWPFFNYWTRVCIGISSITEPECVLALPQLLNQSVYWPFLNYWTRVCIGISSITEPERAKR